MPDQKQEKCNRQIEFQLWLDFPAMKTYKPLKFRYIKEKLIILDSSKVCW